MSIRRSSVVTMFMTALLFHAVSYALADSMTIYADGFIVPSQFRAETDIDDTNCVERAFADGRNVRFDRSYKVTTVTLSGGSRTIDFNGYKLVGLADENQLDSVLRIAGSRMTIMNAHVDANWKNYRCAVHWLGLSSGFASQHVQIYGLTIENAEIGLLFGEYLDREPANVGAESENYVQGLQLFNVQNCIQMNDTNGSLFVSDSTIDCTRFTWRNEHISYDDEKARCIQINAGAFRISNSEILKTQSHAGFVIEGSCWISGCRIEAGGTIIRAGNGKEIFISDSSIQIPSLDPSHPIIDVESSVNTICMISNSGLEAGAIAKFVSNPPQNTSIVLTNCIVQPPRALSGEKYIQTINTRSK